MNYIEHLKRFYPCEMKIWEMQKNGDSYPFEWEREHRELLDREFFVLKEILDIRRKCGGNKGIHELDSGNPTSLRSF